MNRDRNMTVTLIVIVQLKVKTINSTSQLLDSFIAYKSILKNIKL